MEFHDAEHMVLLIGYVVKSVGAGVLAGAVWSALFRLKPKPGE